MNDRLKTIVDLEKYPINDLNSPIIKNLVKKCKEELDQHSCSTISNFILPKSLKVMNSELEKQLDEVYMSKESINAYLYAKDGMSKPAVTAKSISIEYGPTHIAFIKSLLVISSAKSSTAFSLYLVELYWITNKSFSEYCVSSICLSIERTWADEKTPSISNIFSWLTLITNSAIEEIILIILIPF